MGDGEAGIQPLDGYIAPDNLLGLVRNTAPYLFDRMPQHPLDPAKPLIEAGAHAFGFLEVLQGWARVETVEDYFAFCMACHHATVGTFVPTDVDSKIRGLLWRQTREVESARRMFEFAVRSMAWSIEGLSNRYVRLTDAGPVSGHNGEQLSVLAGAVGSFRHFHDEEYVEKAAAAIDQELEREAAVFRYASGKRGLELDALRLAAALTHNAGDLDQGISFWPKGPAYRELRDRFGRLAHENTPPYGGAYQKAALLYKRAVSSEGHRHYPLRQVKALRQSPELLVPFGPFFDDWGALVARHPALNVQDRADVLAALLQGCRTIPGQRGYYRAIAGMAEALGSGMEAVVKLMPSKARSDWKDGEVRKAIAVPRSSFESSMRKLAQN